MGVQKLVSFVNFSYVAPEYANTGMLNEKSDIYSFGVLLLEAVTGRDPVDYARPAHEVPNALNLCLLLIMCPSTSPPPSLSLSLSLSPGYEALLPSDLVEF